MMMPITQSQRQVNPSRGVVAFSVVTVGITRSISISLLLLLCLCEWSDLLEKKSILCILLDYIFGSCMAFLFIFFLRNQYCCIVAEFVEIEVLLLTSGFNNLKDCFYLDIIYLLLFVFVLLGIKGKMIWLRMRSFY